MSSMLGKLFGTTKSYKTQNLPMDVSGVGSLAIVPNDNQDLQYTIRALYIGTGGAGTVTWVSSVNGREYTTNELAEGYHPIMASRIKSTGTTASNLTGLI